MRCGYGAVNASAQTRWKGGQGLEQAESLARVPASAPGGAPYDPAIGGSPPNEFALAAEIDRRADLGSLCCIAKKS